MTTLRQGSTGPEVESLQAWLVSEKLLVVIDGQFGPATERAVRAAQARYGVAADGAVGPKTLAAFRAAGWALSVERSAFPPKPPFAPLTAAQRQKVWGEIKCEPLPDRSNIRITNGWAKQNITTVIVPQLIGVNGAPRDGAILWHVRGVEALRSVFREIERDGLLPLVLTWAGSWVPRYVRGSTTVLSAHAHGTALDINAAWNGLGQQPAPIGVVGTVLPLVPIFNAHNFAWGGHFSRPDGMHFEATKPDA